MKYEFRAVYLKHKIRLASLRGQSHEVLAAVGKVFASVTVSDFEQWLRNGTWPTREKGNNAYLEVVENEIGKKIVLRTPTSGRKVTLEPLAHRSIAADIDFGVRGSTNAVRLLQKAAIAENRLRRRSSKNGT